MSAIPSIYFSLLAELMLISSSLSKDERTSSVSFAKASGFVSKRYVVPAKSVAVVSEPPRMSILPLAWSFPKLRFCRRRALC